MDEEQVVSTEEVAEQAVEQTESTEPEEKTEEVVEEETPQPPKKKQTAQERFDELTRLRRQEERARIKAEQEAEFWRKEALKKEGAEKPPEPSAAIPRRPTLDQFETTEQYEDALFEWRDKKREIEQQAEKQKVEQETAFRTFQERAEKLRQENDDFDEVIERPVFSPAMRDALLLAENGPALAYHLGNNPTEAKRIQALPVVQQLLELGRLETKVLLAKQTKKVTSAPAPPTPVGMAGGAKEIDRSSLPIDEWMALERKDREEKYKKKYGIT